MQFLSLIRDILPNNKGEGYYLLCVLLRASSSILPAINNYLDLKCKGEEENKDPELVNFYWVLLFIAFPKQVFPNLKEVSSYYLDLSYPILDRLDSNSPLTALFKLSKLAYKRVQKESPLVDAYTDLSFSKISSCPKILPSVNSDTLIFPFVRVIIPFFTIKISLTGSEVK